jgi:hypothetical protein
MTGVSAPSFNISTGDGSFGPRSVRPDSWPDSDCGMTGTISKKIRKKSKDGSDIGIKSDIVAR